MDEVQKEVERYRKILTSDWQKETELGHALITRISKAVITTRHFAMPSHDCPRLPADELLRIAAEVTGVPMETLQ
ncbi:MAG: hypothetical protein EOO72_09840, partial [Myxococcaceae bacterium]